MHPYFEKTNEFDYYSLLALKKKEPVLEKKSLISIFGYRLMTSHLPYIAIAGSLSFIAYGVYISKLVFLLVISILIFKNHLFVIFLILKLSRRWSSSLISKISNHKGILSQKKSDWVLVVVVLMAEMLK